MLDDVEIPGCTVEAVSLRCRESKSGTVPGEEKADIPKRNEQLIDEGEGESAEAYSEVDTCKGGEGIWVIYSRGALTEQPYNLTGHPCWT